MFYSIKLKNQNIWAAKKNISSFIHDDSYYKIRNIQPTDKAIVIFGTDEKKRRVYSSTDEIRRSLSKCKKESVVRQLMLPNGIPYESIVYGTNVGTFSNYVVVNLVNNDEYSLDDVINGLF